MKVIAHTIAKPLSGGLSQDIKISLDMPFQPVSEMLLMLPAFGAFQQINDVFWDCKTPDVLDIYFTEEGIYHHDRPTLTEAKKAGWLIDGGADI
jgi:5'-3' exonuclease